MMAEKKFFYTATGVSPLPVTWTFESFLDGIIQGSTASTRIGNKILIHGIQVKVIMAPLTTMPAIGSICRLVIYHNKETVSAVPVSANVFTSNTVTALRNITLLPRLAIKRDMTQAMMVTSQNGAGANLTVGPANVMSMSIYPKKIVDFQSNAGTVTDLFKNDFGIGYICSAAASCTITFEVNVIFSDV